jgi:poly(glycerol-phosphate) alpha-glucosyltransferase
MLTKSVSRRAGGIFETSRGLSAALHHPPELEIRVFGLEDEAIAQDLGAWGGVPVDVSAVRGPRSFGYSPHLGPRIAAAGLDLLHVHGLWTYTSIAARRWGSGRHASYLISPHGMLDPWALQHSRWKKRIVSTLYEWGHLRRAACLHASCDAEYRAIRALGLPNPVCVIPNGVDRTDGHVSRPAAWRRDLPDEARVLLYLGRLHPKKGLADLICGWGEASRQGDDAACDWYLIIAGWDQDGHRAHLEAVASSSCAADTVRFVGPQFGVDKEATFRSSDAFILPSRSEGMPVTVLEAWAYGLPVLMTPHCNLPEGFATGAALLIQPSVESIARQLRILFGMSDDRRREFGARGLQLARTRFDWGTIAAELRPVYRWLSGIGPQPDCVRVARPEPDRASPIGGAKHV